ncbi:hypothetical protein [Nocardia asteroides]|nr:hypothetical protein [Nocardia asteroides]
MSSVSASRAAMRRARPCGGRSAAITRNAAGIRSGAEAASRQRRL